MDRPFIPVGRNDARIAIRDMPKGEGVAVRRPELLHPLMPGNEAARPRLARQRVK